MTRPQIHGEVTRVRLPAPLAVAVKATAQQRGTTVSDVIRLALAREIAQVPNPKKPARPA